jgi:hypothetical protein
VKIPFAYLLLLSSFVTSIAFAQDVTLEPPNGPETPAESAPAQDDGWQFGIGGSLGLGSSLSYGDVKRSGTVTDSGSALIHFTPGISLSLNVKKMQPFSWGFIGGIAVDSETRVYGGEVKNGGTTTIYTDSSDNATVRVQNIFANAAFQWRDWYIPFGLNYATADYTPWKGFAGTADVKSGVGMQFGAGGILGEKFHLELMLRLIRLDMETQANTGLKTDYGIGFLSTVMINGIFYF